VDTGRLSAIGVSVSVGSELSTGPGDDSIGGVRTPVCAKIMGKLAGIDGEGRRDPGIARLGRLGPLKLKRGAAETDGRFEREGGIFGGKVPIGPTRFCVVAISSSVAAPPAGAGFSSPSLSNTSSLSTVIAACTHRSASEVPCNSLAKRDVNQASQVTL
jgi:hypothetical protein